MSWSISGNVTIGMGAVTACACGRAYATVTATYPDGSSKRICEACMEREQQESAIRHAAGWLEAAFLAVGRGQRAKLYRALSTAFHPDQGGDERLMVALNAARERFP